MRPVPRPLPWAASMKGSWATLKALARAMRAKNGVSTRLSATTTLTRPSPSSILVTMASRITGKGSSRSIVRLISQSTRPPT